MNRQKKQRLKAFFIAAGAGLFLCAFLVGCLLFSSDYQKIFGLPDPPKNGVMNLADFSIKDNSLRSVVMSGEWEFFYNKWIITDNNADAEPDCILNLPNHWSGKQTASGEKMKSRAFGSYRLVVLNAPTGALLRVDARYPVAYRVFINGKLNAQNGEPSKDKRIFNEPQADYYDGFNYLVSEGEALEIVIEISHNTYGGILKAPWLHDDRVAVSNGWRITEFGTYLITGIMLSLVIFSVVFNLGGKSKLRNLSLPLFVLLTFIQHLTLPTTYSIIIAPFFPFISYVAAFNLCLALFHVLPAVFFAHIIVNKIIKLRKLEMAVFGGFSAACLILFYAFWGTPYQFILLTLLTVSYVFILYKLALALLAKTQYALFHYLLLIPLLIIILILPYDFFGKLVYSLYPGFSIMLFFIAVIFTTLSYKIVRDNAKKALKSTELENEIGRIRHQALQSQIKPHFIFNALSSIQALYEKNKTEGSDALSKFASHLRQNIDSDINDLTDFSQEIKNIMNYAELENLRLENKFTLLIDIDYTDFKIPTLSLQPLIENAIKYAKTQSKPDGYIRLHSRRESDIIIVEVTDNGAGFNIKNIRKNAVGLKNCRERLKYLLDADLDIQSVVGSGTSVTIKIPVTEDTPE